VRSQTKKKTAMKETPEAFTKKSTGRMFLFKYFTPGQSFKEALCRNL